MNKNLEINKYRAYVNFMLDAHQWSGLERADICDWISNFKGLPKDELLLVYKLLTNIIYYSEKDIINILSNAIYNTLYSQDILQEQIKADFGLSQQKLSTIIKEKINNTYFIPLLRDAAPHESANYITRLLVQNEIIDGNQSMFLDKLGKKLSKNPVANIVLTDDCIGSGKQLETFWNCLAKVKINGKESLLKEYCKEKKINVTYLVLAGYDNTINRMEKELNINICCMRKLSDNQRVFQDDSYVWKDNAERNRAYSLLDKIAKEQNIKLLGYKDFDFALIMHRTIPNWSLSIFWEEKDSWVPLIRRKNSHV